MKRRIHKYDAEGITIHYELKRCIHAFDCIRALPQVFRMQRRGWVDPAGAPADEIAAAIERCPTGALTYRRKDGGKEERVPETNEVRLAPEGPLYVKGNVEIHTSWGVIRDTRVALCRCGASENKPFCDNSHEKVSFRDGSTALTPKASEDGDPAVLRIIVEQDAAYTVEGTFSLTFSDRETVQHTTGRVSLCRCGQSRTMPVCDGAHLELAASTSGTGRTA